MSFGNVNPCKRSSGSRYDSTSHRRRNFGPDVIVVDRWIPDNDVSAGALRIVRGWNIVGDYGGSLKPSRHDGLENFEKHSPWMSGNRPSCRGDRQELDRVGGDLNAMDAPPMF